MALVFQDPQVLSSEPGLHAFIVGVSLYPHLPNGGGAQATNSFGLKQLTSTALSAYRMYEWLLKNRALLPRKLATVHLLVSPSPKERGLEPGFAALGDIRATRDAFGVDAEQWRERARASNDGFALFYFAGHGLARKKGDTVLLCEDFAKPGSGGVLNKAVDHDHLFNGMSPRKRIGEAIARRQVYFVDACRTDLPTAGQIEEPRVPDLWEIELGGTDNREAPIFFATIPGAEAMALDGVQTLFSQAMLACLDHDALRPLDELDANGNPRYGATAYQLEAALKPYLVTLNDKHRTTQQHTMGGRVSNITLRYAEGPPAVSVVVDVEPAADAASVVYRVEDAQGQGIYDLSPVNATPFSHELPAGTYKFSASVPNPQPPYERFAIFGQVMPPSYPVKARVRQ
ncbi:MAG TPA: caspase family protein [Vicinamibacterales bacterium]|jgi:hypothetical protein